MAAQLFREYGKCILVGKCAQQKQVGESQAESPSGGKHVTRAKGWWKRGDVAAYTAPTNMHCCVHQDSFFYDGQEANMREAWEHEVDKDELHIVLQGLEQYFWKGTEAGRMGCYDFPGETWAGDGSANNGVIGAGSVRFQRPGRNLVFRVGREEARRGLVP